MPLIKYENLSFRAETQTTIDAANEIIRQYAAQGYDMTLRQLYYQMVSRDMIPNRVTEYKRLGDVISKARRAGLIDWNAIVDRTRNLRAPVLDGLVVREVESLIERAAWDAEIDAVTMDEVDFDAAEEEEEE